MWYNRPNRFGGARNEGKGLLPRNLDFGELAAAIGTRLRSIVVFRLRAMRPYKVNRYLEGIRTEGGFCEPR